MSNISITLASDETNKEWDNFIDSSEIGQIFHKTFWLKAAEKETKTELIRLIGHEDKRILFVFPIFVKKFINFRMAFSPPPRCLIPNMGLVLIKEKYHQNTFESKYFKICNEIDYFIKYRIRANFIRFIHPTGLHDMRPFVWTNYNIKPRYTYHISLKSNKEKIFNNFKSKTKNMIKRALKYHEIIINNGDKKNYFEIIEQVRKRYEEQGLRMPGSNEYFEFIYKELYERNQIIIKVARNNNNNKFVTGFIVLKYNKKILNWLGATPPKEDFKGINELIMWTVIRENINNELENYDLVGANTKHLCKFKSNFGPILKEYYEVEKADTKGNIIKKVYSEISKIKR